MLRLRNFFLRLLLEFDKNLERREEEKNFVEKLAELNAALCLQELGNKDNTFITMSYHQNHYHRICSQMLSHCATMAQVFVFFSAVNTYPVYQGRQREPSVTILLTFRRILEALLAVWRI